MPHPITKQKHHAKDHPVPLVRRPGGGGGPIGQIEFGATARFDAKRAVFSGGPTAATLSPYVVPILNDAFAPGKGVFVAGEPLGTFSFSARVR